MMNKNFLLNTKIKHILGAEKDLPNYPESEDLFYLIGYWWYHESGKTRIMRYKFMDKINLKDNQIIFTKALLYDMLDKNYHSEIDLFFDKHIMSNDIKIFKETKKDIFYEWYRHIV